VRRTSIYALVVILLLAFAGAFKLHHQNEPVMSQGLVLWQLPGQVQPVRVSVGRALLLCVGFGAAAIALIWGVRGVQEVVQGVLDKRSNKFERDIEGSYQRGLELLLHRRPERALAVMNEILAKDPEHRGALMTGADILKSLGRADEAAALRRRRVESAPDDLPALLALAEDQRAAGDLDLAAATLRKVVELRPKQAMAAAEHLRDVLLEAGQPERALEAHDRLVRIREEANEKLPDADAIRAGIETRAALQVAEQGKDRDAVATLRKILKRHPRFVPAWLALAHAHALGGDEEQAVEAWIEGFEKTNEAAILVEADEYFNAGRHEGDPIQRAEAALRCFKRFAACSGSRPLAVAFLGRLYVRHEMLEEAASAFESVRERFPENPTFTYYVARVAEKLGRSEEAARLYRTVIRAQEVLRITLECRACGNRASGFFDRCERCGRWGTCAVDIGSPDDEALRSTRPLWAVPKDDSGAVEEDAFA